MTLTTKKREELAGWIFIAPQALGFLAFVVHDEQSRAGRAEPTEARIRRPDVRLIVVLNQ